MVSEDAPQQLILNQIQNKTEQSAIHKAASSQLEIEEHIDHYLTGSVHQIILNE